MSTSYWLCPKCGGTQSNYSSIGYHSRGVCWSKCGFTPMKRISESEYNQILSGRDRILSGRDRKRPLIGAFLSVAMWILILLTIYGYFYTFR